MLTNVLDASTGRTIVVIEGGRVQQLNASTILSDGAVIEFPGVIQVEEICTDEERGKAARTWRETTTQST